MIDYILAHLNGLVVDCIFILLVVAILIFSKSIAAMYALICYSVTLLLAHFGLAYLEYAYQLTVSYHLIMAGLVLAFFVSLLVKTNGYSLLKCAVGLNFLLHSVLLIKEPAYQLDLISYNTHTVIYDSYENARIIVVSLQILGLINGIKYGGNNDTNNRLRSRIWRTFNDFRVHTIRLLRVKRS